MFLPVGFSLLLFYKGVLCNQVTQSSPEQRVVTGSEVTLLCTFQTLYSNPDLYWYRIRPDGVFQFVLYRDNAKSHDADFAQGRFSVQHSVSRKTFHLVISSVRPEDTATYYCALAITAYGFTSITVGQNPLIFGKGTYLNVEPKSQPAASPSVFVMKNGSNVACLVKEFYPKDVTISLQSSKKITEYDPAIVVSPGGRYSAVKLGQYGDADSVTCSVEHNKKTINSTEFEPKKIISGTPKPMEPRNSKQTSVSETCYEPQVQPGKVNMMSLSVLGLRMLFAKSVAVNFLLTAKLFFF